MPFVDANGVVLGHNKWMTESVFSFAYRCLITPDLNEKLSLATALQEMWAKGLLTLVDESFPDVEVAGHPVKPDLVPPRELPRRKLGSEKGIATMVHAIAHIEFNAINLACDAVYRFRNMPKSYYADWIKVVAEEAYHFSLLQKRLADLGYSYGDFPAHNGLWDLAQKTRHDVMVRMALIPRVMEARGLDVTPGMTERFARVGDKDTVAILEIILRDEVGHVEAGSSWFRYECDKRGLNDEDTFMELIDQYFAGGITCPLYKKARLDAGFTPQELNRLEEICKKF